MIIKIKELEENILHDVNNQIVEHIKDRGLILLLHTDPIWIDSIKVWVQYPFSEADKIIAFVYNDLDSSKIVSDLLAQKPDLIVSRHILNREIAHAVFAIAKTNVIYASMPVHTVAQATDLLHEYGISDSIISNTNLIYLES